MAEPSSSSSSILESSNISSSDDSIINSVQEKIVYLVPQFAQDNQQSLDPNSSISVDQIEESDHQLGHELASNDEIHLSNLIKVSNPMLILHDSSQIDAIDEKKEELDHELGHELVSKDEVDLTNSDISRSPTMILDDSSPIEAIDEKKKELGYELGHELASNGEIRLTNSKNSDNPTIILEDSSLIEAIDEKKKELGYKLGHELALKNEIHLRNSNNSDNPTIILDDSSQIEAIDEKKQEKKEKRIRKRGKSSKKHLQNHEFERLTVCDCDKRGDKVRVVYSNEDMEALRFLGFEEQKKKWIEVYCRLETIVAEEYDGLVSFKHDKDGNYVNFDPRPQFANKKGTELEKVGEIQNINQVDNVSDINGKDLNESVGGEEDYYEDEDSDNEYVGIQRPAFYVSGEPDFDSGPPQDGLEYLRRVRWEFDHIPKVKIAKVERNVLNKEQTVYMPKFPEIEDCPENLMPSKEWEKIFLADFSELRLALSQYENSDSTFSTKIESAQYIVENMFQENLDFGQTEELTTPINSIQENLDFGQTQELTTTTTNSIQENLDFGQTQELTTANSDGPTLRAILEMEPVARVTMLRKKITSLETQGSLNRLSCAWLFALCAAIDTPLDADTSASIRCLLRKCANLRAKKSELDDEVVMLNILATISGQYFGQAENKS